MRVAKNLLLTFFVLLLAACAAPSSVLAPAPEGWRLVWSDEFDGTQLDRSKWDFELGNGFYSYDSNEWVAGWGNRELEYYTNEPDNVFVQGGLLHLRALKQAHDGTGYTSGRLSTRQRDGVSLFSKTYGRFEFRAKLPTGQGIWPALWLLPRDHTYGGWASSGEIDVMEARGQAPGLVHGTLHYGAAWDANTSSGSSFSFPPGETFADFHVYALEWEPGVMRWYVDNRLFGTKSFWWSGRRMNGAKGATPQNEADLNPWPAPFDQPFYLVMNLAVGGNYGGNPDKTTPFPAEMLVDYVRVYDKVGGYGPVGPRGQGAMPF